MENQQTPHATGELDNFFNIAFDEATRAQIRKAAQWARISTLCAFIGYGVTLIVAFFGRQNTVPQFEEAQTGMFVRTGNIVGTLITVGIGVLMNYYLYRFATETAKGMDGMDSLKTNDGFNNLRVYFKIAGILLIIVLSLAAIGLLFFMIGVGLGRR